MTTVKIIKILNAHSIDSKLVDGKVYALEVFTNNGVTSEKWVNVTNYSYKKLLYWLGY